MTLIEILKLETASLKKQYLELTERYAQESFSNLEERKNWSMQKWYDTYSISYKMVKSKKYIDGNYIKFIEVDVPEVIKKEGSRYTYDKEYYKMENTRDQAFKIVDKGYEDYLKKAMKRAEMHYEDSIIKLASRIEQKGLNIDKLSVKTSHIGVNIDTVLTDGIVSVKTWTIIASGPIQKPHYRYLVK